MIWTLWDMAVAGGPEMIGQYWTWWDCNLEAIRQDYITDGLGHMVCLTGEEMA